MNSFIDFLLESYDLKDDDIDEISTQLTNLINQDSEPTFIIKYLETWLEIPSLEYKQVLTLKVIELSNNTRQWALKGYTPSELLQEENSNTSKAKIIKMTKSNKIGRNEPCPCGSGKKYKKCCGMNKNVTE
jgi:preprotein translocase subunit SecA